MRKRNEHCSWRFIFFIRLKVLNEWKWNADGAIFSFAVSSSSVTVIEQINLKGGWQSNLLGNVCKSTGKASALSLKRNSIYVWKKREANQCCRSVISFQITEDVVHCCEMGLWREVNQVYLLHRLALQWRRERVSLYAGPALQGLDKLPCSEASTPLRHPALFTLPRQAEGFTEVLHISEEAENPSVGSKTEIRLKWVKVTRPSEHERGFWVQNTWVPFQPLSLTMLLI